MRIALAQINPIIGDIPGNRALIERAIHSARDAGARLVVFPELALIGYPPRDLLLKPSFVDDNLQALSDIAASVHDIYAIVGYVDRNPGPIGRPLFNAVAVLHEGKIISRHFKTLLPTYDVFDESRYFEPGPRGEAGNVFTCDGIPIGLSICEDLWNDERMIPRRLYHQNPIADLYAAGARIMLNTSASPFVVGKHDFRIALFGSQVRHFKVPLVYVNQVGGNDELVFDGNSLVLDAHGKIVAHAKDFVEDLLIADVTPADPADTSPASAGSHPGFSVQIPGLSSPDVPLPTTLDAPNKRDRSNYSSDTTSPAPSATATASPSGPVNRDGANYASAPSSAVPAKRDGSNYLSATTSANIQDTVASSPASTSAHSPAAGRIETPRTGIASIHLALVLGLRDYVRKCGFKTVVLGLSGGIDSAVTAALAVDALGADKVFGIALPSRYSSDHSVSDARDLATNLGIPFDIIPIRDVHQSYESSLAKQFAGLQPDVAEENLQARIRGGLLMALSNKFNHLLLTTGNKSEVAVGYCTLYGDMCGGLAVISDVPKTAIYDLARYINATAGRELIPAGTITKPPSAELRPNQVDQDSLPPYDVLDAILYRYVELEMGAQAIIADGYDPAIVSRIIKLVDRSEYKRRQAAPGLKVTSRAFGFGRRMPIAQNYRQKEQG